MDKNYFRSHAWLIYWHGRASKCENPDCSYKNPKRYEWALIKGKRHEKKRENYFQLCASCHRKYDYTENQRHKLSASRKGQPAKNKKKVVLNSKFIYDSLTEASKKTGVSITSISNNLSGLSKKTKVGVWEYL